MPKKVYSDQLKRDVAAMYATYPRVSRKVAAETSGTKRTTLRTCVNKYGTGTTTKIPPFIRIAKVRLHRLSCRSLRGFPWSLQTNNLSGVCAFKVWFPLPRARHRWLSTLLQHHLLAWRRHIRNPRRHRSRGFFRDQILARVFWTESTPYLLAPLINFRQNVP